MLSNASVQAYLQVALLVGKKLHTVGSHFRYASDETDGRSMMAMKLHLEIQKVREARAQAKQRSPSPRSGQLYSDNTTFQLSGTS